MTLIVWDVLESALIQLGSTLCGNTAWDGGAIINGGTLTVSVCTLAGNSATGFDFGGIPFPGRGGAIDNGGTLTVRDSLFRCNSAELGGAIQNNAWLMRGNRCLGESPEALS